ncbi:hypothetical protein SADO_06262 [Salinisphaera dokdonensis CL-ES53]|uniref:Uncharacterized protein n=1 Tax=Salinisphaera dokdonensis CL-ES53 TaxID=1304272 RepID=A0ABV2AYX1_9GAMM
MYSERMLISELSPPLDSGNVADWPGEAPFVFEDQSPSRLLSLALGLRQVPCRGLLILALAAFLLNSMAVLLNPDVSMNLQGLLPAGVLVLLAVASTVAKRFLSRMNGCPASDAAVGALKRRAERHGLKGPMVDAQTRTHDVWRVGHIAQAHAVLDRK